MKYHRMYVLSTILLMAVAAAHYIEPPLLAFLVSYGFIFIGSVYLIMTDDAAPGEHHD